jgi:hypothetical protein
MKVCAGLCSAILIAGCTATCPRGDAPSIVGTWELKPIASDTSVLNPGCNSSVEYRRDGTFLTRNGDMEINGRYELGSENGTLYYCESTLRGNGGKSCQGFTADFVIAIRHFFAVLLRSSAEGSMTTYDNALERTVNYRGALCHCGSALCPVAQVGR